MTPLGCQGNQHRGGPTGCWGSPVAAAVGSLLAFAVGASVPLVPYLLLAGATAFTLSIAGTLIALFLVGLGVSRLTHRRRFVPVSGRPRWASLLPP